MLSSLNISTAIEAFMKIVKDFQLSTICVKGSILGVGLGSGYASGVKVNKITKGFNGNNFETYW